MVTLDAGGHQAARARVFIRRQNRTYAELCREFKAWRCGFCNYFQLELEVPSIKGGRAINSSSSPSPWLPAIPKFIGYSLQVDQGRTTLGVVVGAINLLRWVSQLIRVYKTNSLGCEN